MSINIFMLCVVALTYSSHIIIIYGSIPQALSWAELQGVMLSLEGLYDITETSDESENRICHKTRTSVLSCAFSLLGIHEHLNYLGIYP